MKYPRTPVWPGSPSNPPAHRAADPQDFVGHELVITEKLDGACTMLASGEALTRTGERAPWLAMARQHHAWKLIRSNTVIFGEDLYGVHSIEYAPMWRFQTFRAFAIFRDSQWSSWDTVRLLCADLSIPLVPVLFRGTIRWADELDAMIQNFHKQPSALGGEREGVVIRRARSFTQGEFQHSICKSVRLNHVKADEHWSRHWKPCQLIRSKQ